MNHDCIGSLGSIPNEPKSTKLIEYFILNGFFFFIISRQLDEAVEIATQQKSEEDINFLLSKCQSNRTLVDKLQTVKAQLASKK